jgi:hypothetical protein
MARKKEDNVKEYEEIKSSEAVAIKAQLDKDAEEINPVGRPSSYTKEISSKLCSYLSMGKSLRTACKQEGMPSMPTVYKWISDYPEFLNQYTRAKEESAEALAEDMLDIADESPIAVETDKDGNVVGTKLDSAGVARNRLRVETRKWVASKLKPKKYGDLSKLELTGRDGGSIEVDHYNAALEDLLVTLEKKLG